MCLWFLVRLLFADFFPFSCFSIMPGTRDETRIFIEGESKRGVRAQSMKSSFPRQRWSWIILVCFSEGYTVPRCPFFFFFR